jgi:hypothetical protein
MAKSNDFGSGSRSPGGWGGTGGGNAAGGIGGNKSSSNYNYQVTPSRNGGPVKIGNYNTGGATVGFGNQYGVNGMGENNMGKGPWPGGYAQPVMEQPIGPVPPPATPPVNPPTVSPVVAALANRLQRFQGNPFQRYNTPAQPAPAETIPGYKPQRYINPGAGVDPNGIGRTYSNTTVPHGYATSNPPRYSTGLPGGQATPMNPRTGGAKWP